MGQTLTHGVYLPDEGERNCYAGLAANWQILDGSVGTIAAHTAALAGKAPAVHTHTKSDITDFPVYGNTAGTICEGNDSRLSDARTPVAHTHGKADITDLFNSANTWSETNTFNKSLILKGAFSLGNVPSVNALSSVVFKGTDNNASQDIRFIIDTNGETYTDIRACNKFTSGALSPSGSIVVNEFKLGVSSAGIKYIYSNAQWQNNLTPLTNNTYNLGSSTNQWNNLYAKNYYYNGTAWGLDKTNLWSGTNQFYNSVDYKDPVISDKNPPSTYRAVDTFKHLGNDNTYWGGLKHNWLTDGYSRLQICVANHRLVNDVWTQGFWAINFAASKDFSDVSFYPSTNNSINLGTSTNKWKSFNGVNPGALSLPTLNYTDTSKYVDISGGLSTTGSDNWYIPAVDGWVFLIVQNSPTFVNILAFATPIGTSPAKFIAGSGGVIESSTNAMWCGCPAPAGSRVRIRIKNGTIEQAVFVTCQGNV